MPTDKLNLPQILANELWFGDEGVIWENAQGSADAVSLSDVRIKRLRRKPQHQLRPDFDQLAVADILAGCEEGRRCLNGACPQCSRALQRWLTSCIVTLATNEVSA